MNRFLVAVFATLLVFSEAAATPASKASPAATPTPNAQILSVAKTWFHAMQIGVIDRSQLTSQMNSAMTDKVVAQGKAELEPLGDPTGFEQVQNGTKGDVTYYVYQLTFKDGDQFDFIIAFVADGKINGLRFAPVQ
jgi:hypothetical protein